MSDMLYGIANSSNVTNVEQTEFVRSYAKVLLRDLQVKVRRIAALRPNIQSIVDVNETLQSLEEYIEHYDYEKLQRVCATLRSVAQSVDQTEMELYMGRYNKA